MTYSHEKVDNRQYMNGSDKNPIYAFVTLPRSLSIDVLKHYKDENGNEMIPIGERGYNPYWNIYEIRTLTRCDRDEPRIDESGSKITSGLEGGR